jgi:hypothetical protein
VGLTVAYEIEDPSEFSAASLLIRMRGAIQPQSSDSQARQMRSVMLLMLLLLVLVAARGHRAHHSHLLPAQIVAHASTGPQSLGL